MEGASGEDPGSPPDNAKSRGGGKRGTEGSHVHSPDAPTKKKKGGFKPLQSLKKLFTGRKRTKSKDDSAAPRTRSAESVLCDERGSNLSKKHSMSDDSVFQSKSGKSPSKSIGFQREIVQNLNHGPREEEEEDDDGYPRSPPDHNTTADALIDIGLKGDVSMSDHSLGSMESDTEEDFFRPMHLASGSSIKINTASDEGSRVDLDAIPYNSTTNLANPSAYHKMAVKPKKQGRPGGRSSKTARKAASSPITTSTKSLETVKEKTPMSAGEETPDEDYDVESSNDELDEKPAKEQKSIVKEEKEEEIKAIVIEKKEDKKEEKKEIKIEEMKEEKKEVVIIKEKVKEVEPPKSEPPSEEIIVVKKAAPKQIEKTECQETSKAPAASGVVLRSKPGGNVDISKRQTIAGSTETEITPFGERKKRSSMVVEQGRNWEELEKQKENKEQEEKGGGNSSEFAQMFNKFQRKSVKKDNTKTESDPKPEDKPKPTSKVYTTPSQTAAAPKPDKKALATSSVENKDSPAEQTKKDLRPKPKIQHPKPTKTLIIEKSPVLNEKNTNSEKSTSVQKSGSFKKLSPVTDKAPSETVEVKKAAPVKVETPPAVEKTSIKLETKAEKKVVKTVTIGEKPKAASDPKSEDTATTKVNKEKETTTASFKKESPAPKNRARSQTLPDNKAIEIIKDKDDVSKSPSVKRTASSVNTGSPKAGVRPASKRPEPKKLNLGGGDGGGGPSWIAMARKKTTGWNEDKDKELETKKDENESTNTPETKSQGDSCSDEAKGSHRKSVMDIAKRFQNLQVS